MTDKLYNGFREGRAPGDHKPNNQVRGMTQETMTKEQILEMRISCTCNEAYKTRQMADPDCGRCNWYEEILSCMDFYAQQQLSAETKRAEYAEKVGYETSRKNADLMVKLSAELEAHKKEIELILSAVARGENIANSLNFDCKSELDKERERAWKLVEAAKYVLLFAEKDGWIVNGYRYKECVLELQQTINEYDTATKES